MKPQILVDELVSLGIYTTSNEPAQNQDSMTTIGAYEKIVKVEDNGLTDDDIKLILSAKQTSYLRKIAFMITILAVLIIIGACYWAYVFFKIKAMF